ncbi:hypothetical protein [Pseudomonas agarici]
MGAGLIARLPTGEVLYDTSKSVYGLVRSGQLTEYVGRWSKLSSVFTDDIFKFVVPRALSPIVFTHGVCGQPYQSREGDDVVFYFANPKGAVRVYAFDLMRPIFSGPALKTRDSNESFTFNSLQWPMNIAGLSTPPVPTGPWYPLPGGPQPSIAVGGFSGGNNYLAQDSEGAVGNPTPLSGFRAHYFDRVIDATKNFAAHIPWSRGCAQISGTGGQFNNFYLYGMVEGCSGLPGGIVRHMFWSGAGTTYSGTSSQWQQGLYLLNTDPRPTSMLIDIGAYPYPFDPQ